MPWNVKKKITVESKRCVSYYYNENSSSKESENETYFLTLVTPLPPLSLPSSLCCVNRNALLPPLSGGPSRHDPAVGPTLCVICTN